MNRTANRLATAFPSAWADVKSGTDDYPQRHSRAGPTSTTDLGWSDLSESWKETTEHHGVRQAEKDRKSTMVDHYWEYLVVIRFVPRDSFAK